MGGLPVMGSVRSVGQCAMAWAMGGATALAVAVV